MTTTHDDNATTWRDLTPQLTESQVAHAARFERDALGDPAEVAEMLLDEARRHARQNLNDQLMFGHLPTPVETMRIWHWEQNDEGAWSREFTGTDRDSLGVEVTISGVQYPDGSIVRYATVYAEDPKRYGPDDLRAAAATLIEAADELERLQ